MATARTCWPRHSGPWGLLHAGFLSLRETDLGDGRESVIRRLIVIIVLFAGGLEERDDGHV